jgi:hypothetical protein
MGVSTWCSIDVLLSTVWVIAVALEYRGASATREKYWYYDRKCHPNFLRLETIVPQLVPSRWSLATAFHGSQGNTFFGSPRRKAERGN